MSQVSDDDVTVIQDWLAKEPFLPTHFDEIIIKKFLFSCHRSLERTKRCLEDFCISRANMNEIFNDRDPMSTRMRNAFSNTCVTTYMAGVDEILIHKLTGIENFEFYDYIKSFMLQADLWINRKIDVLPENHIVIVDIKEYTLMLVAKANIFYFQKFILFLLEAMPIRLKQIHIVNCPSYYEYMYGLIKGALPQEIRDMMKFHSDHMGLHKFIDKIYLPSEYDGEAKSMVSQHISWIKQVNEQRNFYLHDHQWKADLSKKVKNAEVDTTMSGSFRTLAID